MAASKLVLCLKARTAGDRRANIRVALDLLDELCTVHTEASEPVTWPHHQRNRAELLDELSKLS